MIALISVEVRRLLSRRLFKFLTALAVLAFAVVGTIIFVASDNSPRRVAQAHQDRAAGIARCVRDVNDDISGGSHDVAPAAIEDPERFCRNQSYGSDPRFGYRELKWILSSLGFPLMMLGWLLGASFMGAEWNNRTVTTTLTWEPRRARVLCAKAVALILIAFAWIVALQIVLAGALYPAGAFEGTMAGVDANWWTDTGQIALRAGGLASLAALLGLSLGTIGRNTAAALGVGFIYLSVIEGLIRGYKPAWTDWLVGDNAALVLVGRIEVNHLGHSEAAAGLLLVGYSAAIFGIALVFFRRRDVA
ncbi:MAG: ABC transporter permease subunit [Actinobacteria bacterium]|nr:ABC transporter permease subunit [Actinomycetota bacterium]